MLSSLNQVLSSLPSFQLILILLLILVILVLGVVIFAPLQRLRRQRILTQTIAEQENLRAQLEAARRKQEEIQAEFEEIRRELADSREDLEEARKEQAEIRKEIEETRKEHEEIQKELDETRKQLADAQELPEEVQIGDDQLANKLWLKLAQECVNLFDELDRKSVDMDAPRQELAGYVCSQLEEILERCRVTIISGDTAFDESRHRPYPAVSRVAAGSAIAETLSPGFIVGPRVLRRARVRLAEETE